MTAPNDPTTTLSLLCEDVARLRDEYLAGALGDRTARAIETHAAECAECGDRLDALTRMDVGGFTPAPPAAARERTLAAVRRRRLGRRLPLWGSAVAVAAAVMVFAVGPWRDGAPGSVDAPAARIGATAGDSAPSPGTIATARSASEFEALDVAARELQQALAATPDDDELRDFLASVRARRAELAQRVKDAAS